MSSSSRAPQAFDVAGYKEAEAAGCNRYARLTWCIISLPGRKSVIDCSKADLSGAREIYSNASKVRQ